MPAFLLRASSAAVAAFFATSAARASRAVWSAFFRLRGGQILESAVDLGVVLVEIGAEYLIVRLPLIE